MKKIAVVMVLMMVGMVISAAAQDTNMALYKSKALATHQFAKKGLTPEQIKGLAGYVKTLGK